MVEFRSIAKFLGAFGAGVVIAGFFLSAPIERPAVLQRAPDFPEQDASRDAGWVLVPPTMPYTQPLITPRSGHSPAEQPQPSLAAPDERDRPLAATTGSSAGAANATTPEPNEASATSRRSEPSCNYALCSRYYRSFDEATCTYQPYRGPRELCTR